MWRCLYLLRSEPSTKICILGPLHGITESREKLNTVCAQHINAPQSISDGRIGGETTEDQGHSFRGQQPLNSNKRLCRRHIDARDKRKVKHKELKQVLFPVWTLQETADGFLYVSDRAKEKEAYKGAISSVNGL